MAKGYKKICPELVDELGGIKASRKELQEKEKDLVEIAKETFKDAHGVEKSVTKNADGTRTVTWTYSPRGCEYEAVYTEFEQKDVKWKDEFEKLYKEQYGKKAYERFLEELPTKPGSQLDVNPKK